MTRNFVIATLISAILGLAMIGGALYWRLEQTNGVVLPANRLFTVEELASYDGKDGHNCLVAVDGDVYLVEGFSLWKNGEHTPSEAGHVAG